MNLVHCSKQCGRFLEVDHLAQAVLALGRGQAERQVPWAWTPEFTGSGPRLQEGGSSLTSPLPGADVGHHSRLAWLQIRGWEGRGWGVLGGLWVERKPVIYKVGAAFRQATPPRTQSTVRPLCGVAPPSVTVRSPPAFRPSLPLLSLPPAYP